MRLIIAINDLFSFKIKPVIKMAVTRHFSEKYPKTAESQPLPTYYLLVSSLWLCFTGRKLADGEKLQKTLRSRIPLIKETGHFSEHLRKHLVTLAEKAHIPEKRTLLGEQDSEGNRQRGNSRQSGKAQLCWPLCYLSQHYQ